MSRKSLEDSIREASGPAQLARNSDTGPWVYAGVPPEVTNWRSEQAAWRETCALFQQSHHMTDLYIEGPDAIRLLSDLGVNSFTGFSVNKAKQFVACNADGYVIGDAVLFFLDSERVSLVGRPSAMNWVEYSARSGGYDVITERDERTAENPTGGRKMYRFQVQGPHALDVLGARPKRRCRRSPSSIWARSRSPVERSGRSITVCQALPEWSCTARGTITTPFMAHSSRQAPTTASFGSARVLTGRTPLSLAGSPRPFRRSSVAMT